MCEMLDFEIRFKDTPYFLSGIGDIIKWSDSEPRKERRATDRTEERVAAKQGRGQVSDVYTRAGTVLSSGAAQHVALFVRAVRRSHNVVCNQAGTYAERAAAPVMGNVEKLKTFFLAEKSILFYLLSECYHTELLW